MAATINYRLVPEGTWPIAAQDARCALAHFRAHAADYHLDPTRVAAWGYSAGGHLASLLGVAVDLPGLQGDCEAGPTGSPQAVISGAGPQDLRELAWAGTVRDFIGGTLEERPAAYDAASPLTHVRDGVPPFLFIHGDQDLFVPIGQSERMRDALRTVGTQADLLAISGGGHVINPSAGAGHVDWPEESADSPEAMWATLDFLKQTLGN